MKAKKLEKGTLIRWANGCIVRLIHVGDKLVRQKCIYYPPNRIVAHGDFTGNIQERHIKSYLEKIEDDNAIILTRYKNV